MARIEIVYPQLSGVIDLEPMPTKNFPAFVEGLIAKGTGFPIFQRKQVDLKDNFPEPPKPIIAYSGEGSVGIIADPDDKVKGAFAITDRRLVYDQGGMKPHTYRDSFRWNFPPHHYYIDEGFVDVVRSFEDAGYPICLSLDTSGFERGQFSVGEQVSLDKVFEMHNT